eukprot:PhM_4_TR18507/c2_g1_i2/m.56683
MTSSSSSHIAERLQSLRSKAAAAECDGRRTRAREVLASTRAAVLALKSDATARLESITNTNTNNNNSNINKSTVAISSSKCFSETTATTTLSSGDVAHNSTSTALSPAPAPHSTSKAPRPTAVMDAHDGADDGHVALEYDDVDENHHELSRNSRHHHKSGMSSSSFVSVVPPSSSYNYHHHPTQSASSSRASTDGEVQHVRDLLEEYGENNTSYPDATPQPAVPVMVRTTPDKKRGDGARTFVPAVRTHRSTVGSASTTTTHWGSLRSVDVGVSAYPAQRTIATQTVAMSKMSPCPSLSPEEDRRATKPTSSEIDHTALITRITALELQGHRATSSTTTSRTPSPAYRTPTLTAPGSYALRTAVHADPSPNAVDAMRSASRRINEYNAHNSDVVSRKAANHSPTVGAGDYSGSGRSTPSSHVGGDGGVVMRQSERERARTALRALHKERTAAAEVSRARRETLFRDRDQRLRRFRAQAGLLPGEAHSDDSPPPTTTRSSKDIAQRIAQRSTSVPTKTTTASHVRPSSVSGRCPTSATPSTARPLKAQQQHCVAETTIDLSGIMKKANNQ